MKKLRFVLCLFLAFLLPAHQVLALSLIRDTEIEETIRLYADPIFEAGGMNPDSVEIVLINDDTLNAFVANGQKIHLFTGLLQASESPEEVIGVIAHETGHILGGHLARTRDAIDGLKTTSYISMVLGAAAAVFAGRGEAAVAVLGGGQQVSQRAFLSYSRTQEQAADQAGVDLLDKVGVSSQGLVDFMKTLEGKSLLISSNRDPYLQTHPAIPDRINFIEHHAKNSPHGDTRLTPEIYARHARMLAKLDGFLLEPVRVLRKYSPADQAVPPRYARSIAYYRQSDLDRALEIINGLLEEQPEDPYFTELKGQMLFENGRIGESVAAYQKSVSLKPKSPLLRVGLAQSQLALESPESATTALNNLDFALKKEPENAYAWKLKSIAYGQLGEIALADLSLAEYFLQTNQRADAYTKARAAKEKLEEKTPAWYRASDIIIQAEPKKS